MKTYHHLVSWALDQPWAVTPRMLQTIQGILAERLSGNIPSAEVIAGRIAEERELVAADARRGGRLSGAVAVMPVYGVLMQRMDMMMEMSGGTSTESLAKQFRALMNDPSVGTIILDIDSPGGGVYGIQELADEIFRARGEKRIVAVANSMAASAAYWIATAASEIVVTPGGEVGSIGVYMLHEDWSGAYEMAGVKPTVIKYGANKAEGIDVLPLDETAQQHFQDRVNQYGEAFTAAVARNRGVSKTTVMKDFGQGMVFGAADAVRLKMADRIATLDQTIARFVGSKAPGATAAALTGGTFEAAYTGIGADTESEPEIGEQIGGLEYPEDAAPLPEPETEPAGATVGEIAIRDRERARLELAR